MLINIREPLYDCIASFYGRLYGHTGGRWSSDALANAIHIQMRMALYFCVFLLSGQIAE